MAPQPATNNHPPSPTRSDKSTESEGKPVRDKLKETRIDAQVTSDHTMNDTPTNGTRGDHSTSGSDSERGRLRRKRSREKFEDDQEGTKSAEKKPERHVRKKSRDVTSPHGSDLETRTKPEISIPSISEKDGEGASDKPTSTVDVTITDREGTPEADIPKDATTVASPKNKRTREQAETSAHAIAEAVSIAETSAPTKPEDERTTKRPRDGTDAVAPTATPAATESEAKIPAAFSNTSATSPFGALSPKPQESKSATTKDQPQTSDSAFKSSGFGAFSSSSVSPFAVGKASAQSPFAASNGNKLSSFASTTTSTAPATGFAALGGSSGQSAFGGSTGVKLGGFGSSFGSSSAFGNATAGSKLTTFGSGSGITGLGTKETVPFGSREQGPSSDGDGSDNDDDGQDDEDGKENADSERRTSQTLLHANGPPETGEEDENTVWTGRAKLYTLAGEAGRKSWQERGVGSFKLNVNREDPSKARFVLRADGTHRLLLNAAITSSMRFGDAAGDEPKDGKLLFTAPTVSGEVESHLLKLKAERAIELWEAVDRLKKTF